MDNVYEQEIDLKDLLFFILHRWRIVLLMALILSVLVGGYKLGKGLLQQQNENYITSIEKQYETDKRDFEQNKDTYENSIKNFTDVIHYAEEYQANSILQKIDPYNKWVASADVFVKMEDIQQENRISVYDSDPADSVLKAYESAVKKGIEIQNLSKEKGLDLKYLKELIRVIPDYQSNMLTITATDTNEAGAQEILDVILKSLKEIYPDVQQNLGGHSIVVMNQNLSTKADTDLAETQKSKIENLTSMRHSLEDTEKKLEELKEPEAPATLSSKGLLKSGIKFGVLGGVAGGFLACFFASVLFCLNNKVYNSDELRTRFGIKILGSFIRKREKRIFTKIDSLLDKLEGIEYITDTAVYERIAANIGIYTEKNQLILLTGTAMEADINRVTSDLKERLPDLRFETAGDMSKYPETLTKLTKVDGIILVESTGLSKYNMIRNELDTIESIKKNVIGCIIL
jgi:capsular polysaccharide biosynthesis protein